MNSTLVLGSVLLATMPIWGKVVLMILRDIKAAAENAEDRLDPRLLKRNASSSAFGGQVEWQRGDRRLTNRSWETGRSPNGRSRESFIDSEPHSGRRNTAAGWEGGFGRRGT